MLPKQPNQSLIDGIRCLQSIVASNGPVSTSEVSRTLGIELTRAHRFLRTLTHVGLLRQNEDRKYAAGPALTVLAAQAIQNTQVMIRAVPPLERLRKSVPHIVAMGVLWMRHVSYVYHARPQSPLERAIGNHEVWPATASGLGVALLAQHSDGEVAELYSGETAIPRHPGGISTLLKELARVRKQGYAFIETHTAENNHTLAIALPENPGVAVGLSGHIAQSELPELLEKLTQCANEIVAGPEL